MRRLAFAGVALFPVVVLVPRFAAVFPLPVVLMLPIVELPDEGLDIVPLELPVDIGVVDVAGVETELVFIAEFPLRLLPMALFPFPAESPHAETRRPEASTAAANIVFLILFLLKDC